MHFHSQHKSFQDGYYAILQSDKWQINVTEGGNVSQLSLLAQSRCDCYQTNILSLLIVVLFKELK